MGHGFVVPARGLLTPAGWVVGVSPRYVDEPPLPMTGTSWEAQVHLHTMGKLPPERTRAPGSLAGTTHATPCRDEDRRCPPSSVTTCCRSGVSATCAR